MFYRFFLFFLIIAFPAFSQTYLFPINPGQKCYLAGNVGEIRQQHFHTGLDIGVDIGAKVYASADGYVSKIKASTYGYGKVIYITHPKTNQQTVYAHLDRFSERIGNLVRQKQYNQESFEVELNFSANQLKVQRGEIIAFSGNTGSSGGPHLHYEIRTMNDIALNPFDFGFSEIPSDNLPPVIKKIAFNTLNGKAKINQQFGRVEYNVLKISSKQYQVKEVVQAYGLLGLEILTEDIMASRPTHTYAVNRIEVKLDEKKIFSTDFNKISHEHNRSMYAHINFEVMRRNSKSFQKCYLSDGNRLKINYEAIKGKGKIKIQDSKLHTLQVRVWDSWGNKSDLKILIKGNPPLKTIPFVADKSLIKPNLDYYISENILVIIGNNLKQKGEKAIFSFNGLNQIVPLNSMQGKKALYLWNLQDGLPDYVEVGGIRKSFNFRILVPSETAFTFKDKKLRIDFPPKALFDTLFMEIKQSPYFLQISSSEVPLYEAIRVNYQINPNLVSRQTAIYWNGHSIQEGAWGGNTLSFTTRNLGIFQIKKDITPPSIKLLRKSPQSISLLVKDDLSEIDFFRATLNGKFLLLNYESKQNLLFSETLQPKENLKGNFRLEVKDKVGNRAFYQVQF